MPISRPCLSPTMPCRYGFRMCLPHLIYIVRPCLIHTCHAMLLPCHSSQGHGTARPPRDGLWATCPHSASSGYHDGVPRRLLPEAYHSSSQRSIPTTVKSGSSTLQKRQSVKLLDLQFGYFRLPRRVPRRLLSEAYQSSSQRSVPTTVKSGSSTLQKR